MKKEGGRSPEQAAAGTALIMAGMFVAAVGVTLATGGAAVVAVGAVTLVVGMALVAGSGFGRGGWAGAGGSSSGSSSSSDSAGGPPSEGCFAVGTVVTLGDGSRKAIETVDVGDLVLSRREDGGAFGAQRVSHIWEHTVHRTLLLNFSDGEQLETTKEHRFHVDGGGFVSAGTLCPGAILNTPVNNVVLRGAKERNGTTQVYNLEVENFHTYFVGDSLVWVHNKKENEGEGGQTEGDDEADNK